MESAVTRIEELKYLWAALRDYSWKLCTEYMEGAWDALGPEEYADKVELYRILQMDREVCRAEMFDLNTRFF